MNCFIRRSFSFSLASLHRRSSSAVYVNEADPYSLALWRSAKPFKQLPGPKCYPVIGALPTFLTSITERPLGTVVLDWFKEYGSLYKLMIPGLSALYTTDPEVFKVMIQNEASNKYPLRGFGFEDKLNWVCQKINVPPFMLFTGGQEWKRLRSAMAKPATPRKVAAFCNQLYAAAEELGTHWLSKRGEDSYITDIRDDLHLWTLKGVVWFVFNKDLPVFEEGNQMADEFAKAAVNFNTSIGNMLQALPLYKLYPTAPFKGFKKAVYDMHAIGESMMKSRFEQIQKLAQEGEVLDEERVSLMEHLLIEEKLTKEQALSQACDILSAGVDTSSNTAAFLLHHIAKEPELQQALYDEVTSVCGLNGVPDFNDFQRMPLVRNCIKETLRLYPPIPIPRLAQTDMVIHGYKVPKNTSIVFELFLIGRDPKLFPNPECFNPYRWEGKKEQDGLVTFGSLPFGAGVRMCYGRRLAELELHLLLANICRRFVLSTDQSSSLELLKLILLQSKDPVRLHIKEREHV